MKVDKDRLIFVVWNTSRAAVGPTTSAKLWFFEREQCTETQQANNYCRWVISKFTQMTCNWSVWVKTFYSTGWYVSCHKCWWVGVLLQLLSFGLALLYTLHVADGGGLRGKSRGKGRIILDYESVRLSKVQALTLKSSCQTADVWLTWKWVAKSGDIVSPGLKVRSHIACSRRHNESHQLLVTMALWRRGGERPKRLQNWGRFMWMSHCRVTESKAYSPWEWSWLRDWVSAVERRPTTNRREPT